MTTRSPLTRRTFLGGLGLAGLAGAAAAARRLLPGGDTATAHAQTGPHNAQIPMTHNKDGAQRDRPPRIITLVFSEALDGEQSSLTISDEQGHVH